MVIYTIDKEDGHQIPCFDNQDEALDVSAQCPVGDMFLACRGVESASPCWIRFRKGGVEHFVAGFTIQVQGGTQGVLVALFRDGQVVHTHCGSLGAPEDGNYHAMAQLVHAETGPTCLGPEE